MWAAGVCAIMGHNRQFGHSTRKGLAVGTGIDGSPNDYDFGEQFSYELWTPNTKIVMTNVPWNSDYRDVAYFASDDALNAYLEDHTPYERVIERMSLVKPGQPVRVNVPFNDAIKYNYLRAYNPAPPVPGAIQSRSFYYFITDVRWIAPNTTEIMVQLDVWQTFSREVTFGNCYIERGHVGIANTAQFDDNGRTWLTVPEGLDIGNEYIIAENYDYTIVDIRDADSTNDYGIIVATTIEFLSDMGTVDNPKLQTAMGSRFESLPNGCALFYFNDPIQFENFQTWISTKPWISQGIISVTLIPRLTRLGISLPAAANIGQSGAFTIYRLSGNVPQLPNIEIVLASNFRNAVSLGSRYANLKKFLTYPYTIVELTTFSGNPLVLKPECINQANLRVQQLMHVAPPQPRIAYVPIGYNAPAGATGATDGEWLNTATGIFDLPTFSVVNNGYLAYMAANRNAIAYQHSSADWSQQRALKGAETAFNQASSGIGLASQMNRIGVDARMQNLALANDLAGVRAIQSGLNSAAGGIAAGVGGRRPGAAAIDAARGIGNSYMDYAIGTEANTRQAGIDTSRMNRSTQADIENRQFLKNSNYDYATFAARGDYANEIAAINAKVQDARLIQPTTSGQIGGDAFNLATYKWVLSARVKTVQPAIMRAIGEYWLRYGYAVQTFSTLPSNYQVMSKFTYWKLRETYITSSSCPELFKQTIRGIFEKGVTVWKTPSEIGNVDLAANLPLTGVTL